MSDAKTDQMDADRSHDPVQQNDQQVLPIQRVLERLPERHGVVVFILSLAELEPELSVPIIGTIDLRDLREYEVQVLPSSFCVEKMRRLRHVHNNAQVQEAQAADYQKEHLQVAEPVEQVDSREPKEIGQY